MDIHYINAEEWEIDLKPLAELEENLRNEIDTYDGTINVVFVNDDYIRALNKAYREKDRPTDVLSFNYLKDFHEGDSELVGEVYISVETTRRQAEENKDTFENELTKLFVHGLLHIHGYDHEEDEEYLEMRKREMAVLKRELPLILNSDKSEK